MAGDSAPDARSRSAAAVSAVGGALAVAGYFLPWFSFGGGGASAGAQTTSISGWDFVNHYLTGHAMGPSTGAPATGTASTSISYALVVGFPMLMGIVALLIGAAGFLRRPTPLLSGLYASAGIMGVLSFVGTSWLFDTLLLETGLTNTGGVVGSQALDGSGLVLASLGFFAIIAGGLTALIRPSR